MPTFENISCAVATTESKWNLCIKVNYPNDNETDYMLLEDGYGILTYKGEMKMEKISVVFSWPDAEEGEVNATVISLQYQCKASRHRIICIKYFYLA